MKEHVMRAKRASQGARYSLKNRSDPPKVISVVMRFLFLRFRRISSYLFFIAIASTAHADAASVDTEQLGKAREAVLLRMWLMYEMGDRRKAKKLYEQAIVAWAENPTPEHEAVCKSYFEILFRRGKYAS